MRTKNTRRGFTLIELLIIMTIIGLLAANILVALSAAKVKANRTGAYAEARHALAKVEECMLVKKNIGLRNPSVPICEGSDVNWPDLAKYDFAYSNGGASDFGIGSYYFSIFRIKDTAPVSPHDNEVFCCKKNGCEVITDSDPMTGSACATLAGF